MYFDTHAHYDDRAFDNDRDELLSSLPSKGVELVVLPGCDVSSSMHALQIAERYDYIYAAAGIHPGELAGFKSGDIEKIRCMASQEKCVAIGEIGLDYYWDDSRKAEQKELFINQLELALELDLPVIIHDREAHADTMEILFRYPMLRGVLHCFSGSKEMAQELLKRGWYLGFDGPVTYKNAKKALEVLEICPLDRILIETDSPYLSPVPMRGKRNDSGNLSYVAAKIAEIKGYTAEDVARISKENGKRLFNI
ncbi:MAG: TatD family hydrolase [Oscillospiraceae bacterium]|nr:TatD family hydrolase [Oscillospiraceae bacterium]